ncbi:MAG: putative amidohydrolase [Saprospiraceae bacterium]|jgi:predicted amidohydrolase
MSEKTSLSVLACQIAVPVTINVAQRDAHLISSAHKVNQALTDQTAQLVVLPELSSIDYSREAFDQLNDLAEALDGPSFQCWSKVAKQHQAYIVYSFPYRDGNETYICIAVVDDEGELLDHYNKLHLAQYGASMEKGYFQRGKHIFIFQLGGFNIAPIICYDIRISELARTLTVDHNVDFILHCGAYYRDESFETWHPFAKTRAMENQVYLLSLNRAGTHYGQSLFCEPWIDEKNAAVEFDHHEEQFMRLELHKQVLLNARDNYTFLKDRLSTYNLPNL